MKSIQFIFACILGCVLCLSTTIQLKAQNTSCTDWSIIVNENGDFNLSSEKTVRYGANGNYTYKILSGNQTCSNATFGTDPAPGVPKTCFECGTSALPPTANCNNWRAIVNENGTLNLVNQQTIRYGADGRYTYKVLGGNQTCSNATFGTDPAPGVPKTCYECGEGTSCETWGKLGNENDKFNLISTKTVRYGANGSYIYKVLRGNQTCSNATFGRDPAPGVRKACFECGGTTPQGPLPPAGPDGRPLPRPGTPIGGPVGPGGGN